MKEVLMEAELDEDLNRFKYSLNAIRKIISEGLMQLESNHLKFKAADSAMVGLTDVKFKYDLFERFDCSVEDELAGINVEHLYRKISKANKDDEVVFRYGKDEEGTCYWEVQVETEHFTSISELPVLNLSEEDIPSTTSLEYDNEFFIDRMAFKRAFGLLEGDNVVFELDKSVGDGILKLDQELDEGRIHIDIDVERFAEYEEPAKCMYSMDYLEKVLCGNRLVVAAGDNNLQVSFNDEFPLSIGFEDGKIMFEFVLAPRIEES